nr:secondary thiamine-phosphate synthase enzyme YjbQ [Roseicella sp. DB1501]
MPEEVRVEQRLHRIVVGTAGRGLIDVSAEVCGWCAAQDLATGLLTIWCRHTSASLLVQENASPEVQADLEAFLARLVPDGGAARYRHADEGPDDMPAQLRAALTQTQLSIPVAGGRPVLGTWQGIYLYEHRIRPHRRELVLHLLGAAGSEEG